MTGTNTRFWDRIDYDLKMLPGLGLGTGARWPWCWDAGPFSSWGGGSFQSWSPLLHPYPGEKAPAAKAGASQGFLVISGIMDSWFRQASCTGVRVRCLREPRGAGLRPAGGEQPSDNGNNS